MTVTERAERSGVVSVLEIRRSKPSDSGIYQCRSTSDRSVAIRRVHVLNGKYFYLFIYFINSSIHIKNFTRETQLKTIKQLCGSNGQHRAMPLRCSQNITQHYFIQFEDDSC